MVVGAVGALWKFLVSDRIKAAEKRAEEYERLWRDEVKLGAQRALMPRDPSEPPPEEIPLPEDWNEKSAVTKERRLLEKEVLDEDLRRFISEKTPPKMFETRRSEVIVIDDDDATVRALHRLVIPLIPRGWRVSATVDPEEGRLWLLEPSVRMAIIDLKMPRLGGKELIEEMLSIRPELRGHIIVCSGALPDDDEMRHITKELGCLWLGKPSEPDEFERTVKRALGR